MRSVSLRLVDLERKPLIPIGFEGENEYMTINFDCKTVFDKHPAAVPTLAVTPPQGDSYPAVVVRDGDIVSWTVCDSDLVYPGEGELQLTFVDGTIIGKTYKARTKVLDSITPSGEAPTPIQNWLTQAAAALQALPTEVASSVAALMGAMVGVGETLDPDDDVTVNYDPVNNTLTIGVPHGRDGEDGHTPAITANKVGKVATFYVDGVAIAQISDGQDADPTVLIDDTSTAQNRTWSAKKLDEEKQSLKTEINSMNTATASDVGKALSPKTVVDGHVTEWEYVDTPIGVNSVTPAKTTFVEEHHGDNLFNPDTMLEVGKWVVNNNGKAELGSNQYTTYYGSIVVPVAGLTAVTIKQDYNQSKIYNYFYTDDSDNIIATAQPKELINNGYTVTLDGTGTKLWITIQNYAYAQDVGVMIVSGSTAKNYEPYYYYLTIPNLQSDSTGVLQCPSEYYAVVGDTLQIFYRGIIKSVYDDAYDVVVRCDIGQAYERFFEVTPVAGDIGTHTLNIKVYTPDHSSIVAFADISLKVVAKMSSPGTEKVVLYVGDSLAENGKAPYEFHRRLTGSGGTPSGDQLTNITFIGSMTKDGTNYEGNGGWSFGNYNSESKNDANMLITCANHGKTQSDQHSVYKDSNNKEWKLETINTGTIKIIRVSASGTLPATGTLTWVSGGSDHNAITYTASEQASGNPFWDSTQQKVDFGTYATRMGESSIDYVYVLLGWNGGPLVESAYKDTVNTFITNVHTSFPNAKIILMGLEIPAREGLAKNYLANNTYSMYYEMMQRVFSLNKWYKEIADATENVYFLNIAGQFDSKNNMQTATRALNTRNATTETYQSNGVHPADSGYYQIADACYRHFNWLNS